ncbi:MAG: hypothetical protein WCO23_01015 [bacterium]
MNSENQHYSDETGKDLEVDIIVARLRFLIDKWRELGGKRFTVSYPCDGDTMQSFEVSAGNDKIDASDLNDEEYSRYLDNPNYMNLRLQDGVMLQFDPNELLCKRMDISLSSNDRAEELVKNNLLMFYGVDATNPLFVSSIHKYINSSDKISELSQRFKIENRNRGVNFSVSPYTIEDFHTNVLVPSSFSSENISALLGALYFDKSVPSEMRFKSFFQSTINDWVIK